MIRRATIADLDAIMDIERRSFPTDAWSAALMAAEIDSPHGQYFVDVEPGVGVDVEPGVDVVPAVGVDVVPAVGVDVEPGVDAEPAVDVEPAVGVDVEPAVDAVSRADAEHIVDAEPDDPNVERASDVENPVPGERGERVVGYGGVRALRGSGDSDIQTIALDAAHRGSGRGRALLRVLLQEAAERGARETFLEVRADNPVAEGLYAAEGFVEIGRRPGYYQPDDVAAIIMRLDLGSRIRVTHVPDAPTAPQESRTDVIPQDDSAGSVLSNDNGPVFGEGSDAIGEGSDA